MGLMGRIVRREVQRWFGTGVGHAKSGPTTINLHVGAHWHLSENVEAWLDLLETSVAARI